MLNLSWNLTCGSPISAGETKCNLKKLQLDFNRFRKPCSSLITEGGTRINVSDMKTKLRRMK